MKQIIPFNAHANPFFVEFYRKKIREHESKILVENETNPITEVYAVKDTLASSESLVHENVIIDLLKNEFKMIESASDKERKENVLLKLNHILKMWMKKIHDQMGLLINETDSSSSNHFARLVCYGSYKLGVSGPLGDIDTLILAPLYVDRELHFFGLLFSILKDLSSDNQTIKELICINDKHSVIPLISMCFYDVKIDIVFATLERVDSLDGKVDKLGLSDRPNLNNDELIKHMDEKMKSSYNGFRNAEMMLAAIVVGCNKYEDMEKRIVRFRTLLRCVKKIAQANGIAQNKAGFLAGISLALLAVKIVQLYPNYSTPHLLERFFWTFGYEWQWDSWKVLIVPEKTVSSPNVNSFKSEFMIEKKYMTIITAAYPTTNSSYNVRYSTRNTIISMFKDIHSKITLALAQKPISDIECFWKLSFKEFPFFKVYDQYIEINIVGNDQQIYIQWKGFIESKVRFLIRELEKIQFYFDFDMQLWPETFSKDDKTMKEKNKNSLSQYIYRDRIYIGTRLNIDLENPIDLNFVIAQFISQIDMGWQHELGKDPDLINIFIYIIDKDETSGSLDDEDNKNFIKKSQTNSSTLTSTKINVNKNVYNLRESDKLKTESEEELIDELLK